MDISRRLPSAPIPSLGRAALSAPVAAVLDSLPNVLTFWRVGDVVQFWYLRPSDGQLRVRRVDEEGRRLRDFRSNI